MLTRGDSILVLGSKVNDRLYGKTVTVNAQIGSFTAKVRDVDELTISTMFGENTDPREYACLHGTKPAPQLDMQQIVTIAGEGRVRVVKTALDHPGTPFWEIYVKREVDGKDA